MPNEQSRIWWPFAVVNQDKLSQDEQAKLTFLEEAARQGFRAFVQQSDCGAVAPDGRECYLIWRGRQRSELLLIDHGAVIVKKMFADPSVALAFRQAYAEGLAWLRACPGTSA